MAYTSYSCMFFSLQISLDHCSVFKKEEEEKWVSSWGVGVGDSACSKVEVFLFFLTISFGSHIKTVYFSVRVHFADKNNMKKTCGFCSILIEPVMCVLCGLPLSMGLRNTFEPASVVLTMNFGRD